MCFIFFRKSTKSVIEPEFDRYGDRHGDTPAETQFYGSTEKETPTTKDYSFSLRVNDESSHGRSRTVCDPSETEIDEAVNDLVFNENNFIVLESANPINDFTYIQANGYQHGERTAYTEIQHIEIKNGKKMWSNYYKTLSLEALKGLLKEFLHKNTPSLYDWDHMMSFDENGDQCD